MIIIATDDKGNVFDKELEIIERKGKLIVSLGAPYEWYYDTLKIPPTDTDRLYIDAMGRNHKGSPVSCNYYELMNLVEQIKPRSFTY